MGWIIFIGLSLLSIFLIIRSRKKKKIKDYKEKKDKLEQAYSNKVEELNKKFFIKEKELENSFKAKEIELEDSFRVKKIAKERELEDSFRVKETNLTKEYNLKKEQFDLKFNYDIREADLKKQSLENQLKSEEEKFSQLKKNQMEILKEYKDKLELQMANEVKEKEEMEFARIASAIEAYTKDCKEQKETLKKEISDMKEELSNFKAKRNAINEEILRQKELEENEDFYRIVLDDASLHDLALLNEIKNQFSKIDLLQKLMYDNYVSRPLKEMAKRVLNGSNPCGIYKITRKKTGEIYIGQSVKIMDRWTQHGKSCFHCGTISHSVLHTTMERDGIQNFTWELLEEVPKEKLNEREKYWIEFYDSKKYGMNEKAGG